MTRPLASKVVFQKMYPTFDNWMQVVNSEIEKRCGMFSDDLPDWDYYWAYEQCWTPKDAAEDAIAMAKEF